MVIEIAGFAQPEQPKNQGPGRRMQAISPPSA